MSRECPCGCGRNVTSDRYSCGASWRRLPVELRREITVSYGRRRTLAARGSDDYPEAARRHEAAKTAADAWLTEHPARDR